jgi:hypothetical protein
MEEAIARARLVDLADDSVSPVLTTTISRSEVEDALRTDDGPMDLVLDVTRYAGEGEAQTAVTEKIAVSWEPEDLEDLLRRAEGDSVTLAFDGQAVLRALEADVEAHGIREGLAVLAVAVVAGSAAGVAAAQPQAVEGGVTPVADIEAMRMTQPLVTGTDVAPGADIEAVRAAQPLVTGTGAAPGADIEAARAAQPLATGTGAAPGADIEAARAAQPLATGTGAAPGADIEAARAAQVAGTQQATDSGISVSLPSAATAAVLVGGIALLITGAAFVARERRLGMP